MTKIWRTRFPYLGLAASALTALVAYQSVRRFAAPGELTFSAYLVTSINICSTAIIPIFSTVFAATLIAGETSRGTLRSILPRPIRRSQFLNAKLLAGFLYLLLLFAANLAVSIPIAMQFPAHPALDELAQLPSAGLQVGIFALGFLLTLIPHLATVCFGFMVSVLSRSLVTSIGVAVGIILSLMPLQVLIHFGSFDLEQWLFTNYYDAGMKIVANKTSAIYDTWAQESVYRLLGTGVVSAVVFLAISYWIFLRRDINE